MSKYIQVTLFAVVLFVVLITLVSCDHYGEGIVLRDDKGSQDVTQVLPDVVSFNYHIRPILSDRCFKCHGPDKAKIEAGLSFSSFENATITLGDSAPHYAIIANDTENSTLIDRITTEDPAIVMPPPESNLSLSQYEKELLIKWIAQGAKWEEHWAFLPIELIVEEETDLGVFVINNEIDKYVVNALRDRGLPQAPVASRERLIRRVAFDVTGLPPSLEEIDVYLNDGDDDAYVSMVDRYLSSSAYAERMTSMWLDVARYADTHGYQDDLERVMWPWRDWVLHAFENNMPYNQFVEWQLAGDLLPNATKEQIIATGFNRNHKITQEGGVIPEEYLVEYVSDRTMTFGKAFLGLTVDCAKCHDHKYDPISQEEYYSLFSFFNTVPEKGLIEAYGITPEPYLTISQAEIDNQLTFIKNLDSLPQIELMVMKDQPGVRETHILTRGAYDHPAQRVFPKTPDAVLSFDGYAQNRKGLSDWLFDKNNPLTARVMVNRLWMICYGRGLVATADDFGSQGALPSHPKLIDHLASRFQENGWDIKDMIRYMLMSHTYKQSSHVTEQQYANDVENKYYSRGSRVRLSAEQIRDNVLASSGLLVQQVGGPSVKPYQPAGLWEEFVGGGGGSTKSYEIDKGDKQYRRSLYTFWKRTVPPPDMMTFDAVTRDFCMVSRERTSTPLQALVMMNSPQIVEAARNLAHNAIQKTPDEKQRIQYIFRSATSREATDQEVENIQSYLRGERERFADVPDEAKAYLMIGDSRRDAPNVAVYDLAAYAMVANMIYNLDESITRS